MKTKYFLLMVALCCFFASTSWAQKTTPQIVNECRSIAGQAEIEYENNVDRAAFQKRLEYYLSGGGKRAVIQQYAIQFHIIRMDDGTGGVDVDDIRDEFENFVNPYFAAIDIEFVECGPEQYHNSTEYFILGDGSEDPDVAGDQMSADFNVADVINMYFVSDPDEACGWARFPWNLPVDYIVIANSCADNNSTIVHELGHYFGLYHTHETALGEESVTRTDIEDCDADCDEDGDLLCDTPADPNLSSTANSFPDCGYTGTGTDECDIAYSPAIDNIMSYADKRCRDVFSSEQLARMEMFRDDERDYLTIVAPPTLTNPASDMTVECDGSGNVADFNNWLNSNGGATAADACGGSWSNNSDGLSDRCGATGSEEVTFTFTATTGNSVSTTATFTIEDTTDPSLTCPDDIHLPECVETASWTPVTSDVCGGVTVVSVPPSGSVFPKGTTTVVTVTATDDCGNTVECTFEVTRDPDLVVDIDPLATSSLETCASGTGANIVLGYGGGPTCVTLHATGSGGHAPYTYEWDAPAEVPAGYFTNTNTASPTFCAGFQTEACATYTFVVTITDIHGCTETNTVDVNVINPLCTDGRNPKVWVCHRPPGNPPNEQSLCISSNAVATHLNGHDDCLGHCDATCSTYSALVNGSVADRGEATGNVSGNSQFQMADSYALSIKPNPFNSTAVVIFSAAIATNARLIVLDVNGQQVANLFEGSILKNTPYAVNFEAENLQSGIYYARLIGEDGTSISAAVLLVR